MLTTKDNYLIPSVDLIEVKPSGVVMTSPDGTWDNSTPDSTTWGSGGDGCDMD